MNRRLVAVGLAVMVGVASIAVYSIYEANLHAAGSSQSGQTISSQQGNTTYQSSKGGNPISTWTNSTMGLMLVLTVKGTYARGNESLTVREDDYNPLSTVVNVTARRWNSGNIGIGFGPCVNDVSSENLFSVFVGYFTLQNFSGATPLQFADPNGAYSCPANLASITHYAFQPMSDSTYIRCAQGCDYYQDPVELGASVTMQSVWTTNAGHSVSNPLPKGTYTVVARDEWGAIAILHFELNLNHNLMPLDSFSAQPTALRSTTAAGATERTTFGFYGGPNKTQPTNVAPNVMLWESFTLGNSTRVDGIKTNLLVSAGDYDSILQLGLYVNGSLRYNASVRATAPQAIIDESGAYILPVGTTFPAGTELAIALMCGCRMYPLATETKSSYVIQSTTLPTVLPSTTHPAQFTGFPNSTNAMSFPYEFNAWGYVKAQGRILAAGFWIWLLFTCHRNLWNMRAAQDVSIAQRADDIPAERTMNPVHGGAESIWEMPFWKMP